MLLWLCGDIVVLLRACSLTTGSRTLKIDDAKLFVSLHAAGVCNPKLGPLEQAALDGDCAECHWSDGAYRATATGIKGWARIEKGIKFGAHAQEATINWTLDAASADSAASAPTGQLEGVLEVGDLSIEIGDAIHSRVVKLPGCRCTLGTDLTVSTDEVTLKWCGQVLTVQAGCLEGFEVTEEDSAMLTRLPSGDGDGTLDVDLEVQSLNGRLNLEKCSVRQLKATLRAGKVHAVSASNVKRPVGDR